MYYCEECKELNEQMECESCGKRALRYVTHNDFCLLVTCEQTLGDMICFSLEENKIESAKIPFGDGARTALGLGLGNYAIYVPYKHYEQAREIAEYYTADPTIQIKKELLDNLDKWHVSSERAEKKIRKKLKLSDEQDLFDYVKGEVEVSQSISDEGLISTCTEGGHYILVRVSNRIKIIWFNSKTFEIFL